MFAGVVHTVKCIFKKHDIDLISEFVRKIRKVIKIQNSDVMSVCLEKITNAQLMLLSVDMRIRRANK